MERGKIKIPHRISVQKADMPVGNENKPNENRYLLIPRSCFNEIVLLFTSGRAANATKMI